MEERSLDATSKTRRASSGDPGPCAVYAGVGNCQIARPHGAGSAGFQCSHVSPHRSSVCVDVTMASPSSIRRARTRPAPCSRRSPHNDRCSASRRTRLCAAAKRAAATMLWGCSSGTLKYMGEFDRTGTPYNYMLAGWSVSRASPAVLESLLSNRLPTRTAPRDPRIWYCHHAGCHLNQFPTLHHAF